MTSTKRAAISALVLSLTFGSHEARAQQKAAPREVPAVSDTRAAALVVQGKAAFAAGNMHEALRAFRDAWELAKTSQIAANLGTIEQNFGQHRDAAEHLWFALSHLSAAATDAQRQAISEALDGEKRHVVTLLLHGAPPGASISIDDKAVSTAPVVDEIYVDPGQHSARAECAKYQGETRMFDGLSGATIDVTFNLMPTLETVVTPPARVSVQLQSSSPQAASPGKPSLAVVAIGGGIVLLGIATGTVFLVEANRASRDAQDKRDALGSPNACGTGTPFISECKSLHDTNVAIDRDNTIAATALVIGGAAAIGTLVYEVWPRKHSEAKLHAGPVITPQYTGFQALLRW